MIPDPLEQSSGSADPQRERHLARLGVYQRPGLPLPDSIEMTATIGRIALENDVATGAPVDTEMGDDLIRAAHASGPVLPRRADRFDARQDGLTFVYEVNLMQWINEITADALARYTISAMLTPGRLARARSTTIGRPRYATSVAGTWSLLAFAHCPSGICESVIKTGLKI